MIYSTGWFYLTVILDLYSQRIVGQAMGPRTDAALALEVRQGALHRRKLSFGLIVYSDREKPFASHAFSYALRAAKTSSSMSSKSDNPRILVL